MSAEPTKAILSEDYQTAEAALNEAIAQKDVPTLEAALGQRSYLLKTRAAEALGTVGNVGSVPKLRDCLAKHKMLIAGGTEQQLDHAQLVNALVTALEQLTGQDFGPVNPDNVEEIEAILAQVNRWLTTQ
ncbi:MAG: hypothetical protein H6970_07285 [Gammaproteobacteria bacterium]|nr:hypothetical protein [Gammaproteobacteria bacterium]MCP5424857.1 hypothetical protein [Gammaproteobacteria bacterium]MCP5458166.1 hypothetical protein [Gammaproteobacteria bacterium]